MICKRCNSEVVDGVGCFCMRLEGKETEVAVYQPRTKRSLGGHLGASEASFERGWHPELDAGLETS